LAVLDLEQILDRIEKCDRKIEKTGKKIRMVAASKQSTKRMQTL
jgi:hypothetical protein